MEGYWRSLLFFTFSIFSSSFILYSEYAISRPACVQAPIQKPTQFSLLGFQYYFFYSFSIQLNIPLWIGNGLKNTSNRNERGRFPSRWTLIGWLWRLTRRQELNPKTVSLFHIFNYFLCLFLVFRLTKTRQNEAEIQAATEDIVKRNEKVINEAADRIVSPFPTFFLFLSKFRPQPRLQYPLERCSTTLFLRISMRLNFYGTLNGNWSKSGKQPRMRQDAALLEAFKCVLIFKQWIKYHFCSLVLFPRDKGHFKGKSLDAAG